MKKRLMSFVMLALPFMAAFAGGEPEWDSTAKRSWLPEYKKVEIPSSKDGKLQKAYIYKSRSKSPMPLIVSLHTWSGYYNQTDPLTKEILARDWNYIHPDFRGANRSQEAMGSPLVLADIEDAISYAIKNMNVDPDEVHIVGVSGGGYATLASFMNIDYPVKSFSAWAAISDIEDWYWENRGRSSHYADDIQKALDGDGKTFDAAGAAKRSPLRQSFPAAKRRDSQLYIYAGIHDGYKGSVPVTHSMKMYNRIVGELIYGTSDMNVITEKSLNDTCLISPQEMLDIVSRRLNPEKDRYAKLFDRDVHFDRSFGNVHIKIFEGKHEQIPQALGLLPVALPTSKSKCRILAIGDSNGEIKGGWGDRLKAMMPDAEITNISNSGRTIGFDNNGRERLNALKNIDTWLDKELAKKKRYDYIIVCLGTNDTKKMFDARQEEVPGNLKTLLAKIKKHKLAKKGKTKMIYMTPPPLRHKDVSPKYENSGKRLANLIPQLKAVAEKSGFEVIDIYTPLLGVLDYYAKDGVHMAPQGQQIVASKIIEHIGGK